MSPESGSPTHGQEREEVQVPQDGLGDCHQEPVPYGSSHVSNGDDHNGDDDDGDDRDGEDDGDK